MFPAGPAIKACSPYPPVLLPNGVVGSSGPPKRPAPPPPPPAKGDEYAGVPVPPS